MSGLNSNLDLTLTSVGGLVGLLVGLPTGGDIYIAKKIKSMSVQEDNTESYFMNINSHERTYRLNGGAQCRHFRRRSSTRAWRSKS